MNDVYRLIIEKTAAGKIDKQTAIDLTRILKQVGQKDAGDIAIIGMSVKMPMAEDVEAFWDNIKGGIDCVTDIPETRRKDIEDYLEYSRTGSMEFAKLAYLKEIDKFDYGFFNIPPRDASLMDPHQRLFLQAAWGAVEDAGYTGDSLAGTTTGVYVGFGSEMQYKDLIYRAAPASAAMALPGNLSSVIAGRIAYMMNLKGPAVLVNTACSSSLVALHWACQAIKQGDCDLAIAGGVKINLTPFEKKEKVGIESSDGRTRTFDNSSDGTGSGEGVGAVLLKPLAKALEDRDPIYAVIKGSAVNQDGSSVGITAPNPDAQRDLCIKAWKNAQVEPESISYIEAHGTGTKLGDPIEIEGLQKAFKKYTDKKQFCAIGSVKTNIGHLDDAAGIAGLIKAALALKHKLLPPSIHFNYPNRKIDFEASPVFFNDVLRSWETAGHPRRCGVSSFGLSGTNCHVVLEEAPAINKKVENTEGPHILALSARSKEALSELVEKYIRISDWVQTQELEDICFTANTGRGHYSYRAVLVLEDGKCLRQKLGRLASTFAEGCASLPEEGIFYGCHKIVNDSKKNLDSNEITDGKRRVLSLEADHKVKEYLLCREKSKLEELSRLYTAGADIDWKALYCTETCRKVSLPGYPFERKRCWLEIPKKPLGDVQPNQADRLYGTTSRDGGENQIAKDSVSTVQIRLNGRDGGRYTKTEELVGMVWNEVLGFEEANIYEDLYALGGDSIHAMKIVNRINRELSIKSDITELLRTPTIEGFARCLDESHLEAGKHGDTYSAIKPTNRVDGIYPVSPAQKRLLILNNMEGENITYNMPSVMIIEGRLDKERLKNVFEMLVKRHDAFRISFEFIQGEAVQKIHYEAPFEIVEIKSTEAEAKKVIESMIYPFDLSKAPLLRVGLIELSAEKTILVCDMHHIISDGASMGILNGEFMRLYNGEELPELRIQYKDFSEWQDQMTKAGKMKEQEDYWLEVFQGGPPVLNLPTDEPRPSMQSFEGSSITFEADAALTGKIYDLAKKTGATIYMVLLSVYHILLSKYSGQEDIVVGSPITGRPHADLENIIGMFVNTLALRNYPENCKTYSEFLREVKENALKAYENQDYQFEELVEKLGIKRDLSRNPLFDVMFVLQNNKTQKTEADGIKFRPYAFESKTAKFDLTLNAVEQGNKIIFLLDYCTRLFKKETAERMAGHYIHILREVAENPGLLLKEIEMLADQEKQQILTEFNRTQKDYAREKTTHRLFEEQVEKTPENTAVVFKDKQLTYQELNRRANQLARNLREKGVGPNSIVGIIAERSFEMIIGILGILKAGGAYLPIDPGYPEERISYMLENSSTQVLLTQGRFMDRTAAQPQGSRRILNLEEETLYTGDAANLEDIIRPQELAYVIFTSGTTGEPKGVMVSHGSISVTLQWRKEELKLCNTDKILLLVPYSFDGFVINLFTPVISGSQVYILDEKESRDPVSINRCIAAQAITNFALVPMLYSEILKCSSAESLKSLKMVILAGEKTPAELIKESREKNIRLELVNEYGPTEATVLSTIYRNMQPGTGGVIGKPIANTRIYMLDRNDHLQPVGVEGELCIAGERLAAGYLKRPDLTAEKFVTDPFFPGERMYRTGDLARWLPDGNIEFIGRIDQQVKVRGYRIELGEIEEQLLKHESITEAVVIAREENNGSKYLCAYIVSGKNLKVSELRGYLSHILPDYMVPSYIIQLDKMPLNRNGKLDRKALPEPDRNRDTGIEYAAPSNETEEKLAALWQEILKIESVGVNDNFFELGGHSLKAATLVSRIHKEMDVEIPLREVFNRQTVKELAAHVREAAESTFTAIVPAEKREYYPLSAAQRRLYIVNRMEEESTAYNMPGIYTIEGELDRIRLEEAFSKLVQRHETLRTSFGTIHGEPVQRIHEDVEFRIEYLEAEEGEAAGLIKEYIRPFDLMKAPLFRVTLIRIAGNRHILLYDMHHIISDGASMNILTREFAALYKGESLPGLKLQYRDYTLWQDTLVQKGVLKQQEEYWLDVFKGEIPVLDMPLDYSRPEVQSFEGDHIEFLADRELTAKLKGLAAETGATVYMVLLAAYTILLSKYTGQEDIIVGTPVSGRSHADLENIIGVFINILAMRNYPMGGMEVKDFLLKVKENALKAYENQSYPFDQLVEKLNIQRSIGRNPVFDVMFNLQNVDNTAVDAGSLNFIPYAAGKSAIKFDLNLVAIEAGDRLAFRLEYCIRLFKRETIERMTGYFNNLLKQIAENPDMKISKIEMVWGEESLEVDPVVGLAEDAFDGEFDNEEFI